MTHNILDSSAEKYPLHSRKVLTIKQIFWTSLGYAQEKRNSVTILRTMEFAL